MTSLRASSAVDALDLARSWCKHSSDGSWHEKEVNVPDKVQWPGQRCPQVTIWRTR
jgi:hypothetical protein